MSTLRPERTNPLPSVAVIGMGIMGSAMTSRLIACGIETRVWSRQKASTLPLVEQGASGYDTAAEAVQGAEVVITMLPTADVTSSVMLDVETLAALRPETIWAQMGTIGVKATSHLISETQVRRPDITFVDAPVSGSRGPAESGQLLILASGPHDKVAEALGPVFDALGRSTLWLGPAGSGSAMKLVLNTWLAFQAEGAAEAASLADHLGVSSSALFAALQNNPLASDYALAKLTKMVEHDYSPEFGLEWALKDLDLVASDAGIDAAPVARAIADRWRGLVRDGSGQLDVSAVGKGLS